MTGAKAARVVVKKDGSVVYDGDVIGSVRGEPRNWWFMLADASDGDGPWHSKSEAADMCARAYRKTLKER